MKYASRTRVASTGCSRATLQWRSRERRIVCEFRLPEIERGA